MKAMEKRGVHEVTNGAQTMTALTLANLLRRQAFGSASNGEGSGARGAVDHEITKQERRQTTDTEMPYRPSSRRIRLTLLLHEQKVDDEASDDRRSSRETDFLNETSHTEKHEDYKSQ